MTMDLKERASFLSRTLKDAGIEKYAFQVSESETKELNTELTDFSLFRTIFDGGASVTAFLGGKKGSASGSDLTDQGLAALVEDAKAGAESSVADEANDIAEKQAPETFVTPALKADMERLYDRVQEMISEAGRDFPLLKMMQVIASHSFTHRLYVNSNGTCFEANEGEYSVTLEYAGNDGEKTTGIAYASLTTRSLDRPLLDSGTLRKQLKDTQDSLHTFPVKDKFEGTVLLTPDALADFASMLVSNFLSGSVIMDGTSLWLNKAGEKVASSLVTLRLQAEDDRLVLPAPITADGYRAENVPLLEAGVLRNYLLNLYAAKKTGLKVTRSGSGLTMDGGDTPVEEMIRSIRRGLIVGGFSGGQPGANGEFSGVAKNSFYVEDGQIRGAVMETMISGTLQDLFSNVTALSREVVSNGSYALPYLAAEGITISGS